MSSAAAAGGSSSRRSRYPPCILLKACIDVESHQDSTTAAITKTRNNLTIQASCYPAQPPLRSKFFVYCDICQQPNIISSVEDLLLFRVTTATATATRRGYDYFIYRAGARPSLDRIPHPVPDFADRVVGLLPRGRSPHYTVAALVFANNEFNMYQFNSLVGSWTFKPVSLETPPIERAPFPVEIPPNSAVRRRLKLHRTNTVVTLGGETGTMGWVDLWSGIMLCDLLLVGDQDKPTIRHLPLPLPMDAITCNNGMGADNLGPPAYCRGIAACINCGGKPFLKFAELKLTSERLNAETTDWPVFRVDDWSITTWTNTKLAGSYEDWEQTFTVLASKIKISDSVFSELQNSGLLQHEEKDIVGLQHILVYEPKPSLNGEDDVVYLIARPKFMHPKAYALAVDMKKNQLLGVSEFSTGRESHSVFTYHTSAISKYMNPPATTIPAGRN